MGHTDKTAGPGPEWSIRVQDNQALIKPEKKKQEMGRKRQELNEKQANTKRQTI
jgi:hypothetical protein